MTSCLLVSTYQSLCFRIPEGLTRFNPPSEELKALTDCHSVVL